MRIYTLEDILATLDPLEPPEEKPLRTNTAHLAGSRFNELVHPRLILQAYGFTFVRTEGIQEHYHYKNASHDNSATIWLDDEHTTFWSETAAAELGVEARRPMDSYGLWTRLAHGGDFVSSHAWLVAHGIPDLGGPAGPSPKAESRALATLRASRVDPGGGGLAVAWLVTGGQAGDAGWRPRYRQVHPDIGPGCTADHGG